MSNTIEGKVLRDMIISGTNNIKKHKVAVNELNVFPVPDGDTGTNMSLTMQAAATELQTLSDTSVKKVIDTCADSLLRGARGNSGVILSLLFRGIAKGIDKKMKNIDGETLAKALTAGVGTAYKAVMKPTEGTILTVARVAAENAEQAAERDNNALFVLETYLESAIEALQLTPELLPVLKQAGVVDAGGKGLVVIVEGMLSVLKDGVIIKDDNEVKETETSGTADFSSFETEEINFTYCTEFIINRTDDGNEENAQKFRSFAQSIGDSAVVADSEDIIKVHVHTNNPDMVIGEALKLGSLIKIKIDNMRAQHEELKGKTKREIAEPTKQYGFVAVSAGEGFDNLFADLSVDNIVTGGQTMNPSTDDILSAVDKTPAEVVFVFPNNKNIILAAEQAVPLSGKKIIVVPTKTIPQGIACLLAFDETLNPDQNRKLMIDAANKVKTGQITYAVRDSDFDGKKIKEGEILALSGGKVVFKDKSVEKAAIKLALKLITKKSNFVSIYFGEEVTEDAAEAVKSAIAKKAANVEITLLPGGQPVYYYIISVE